nr:hydroxymethylglutaryl-CoA reductase (NADPH2) (EC 1.1.1.34) - rat (fragments) [Rattus norvegicus]
VHNRSKINLQDLTPPLAVGAQEPGIELPSEPRPN